MVKVCGICGRISGAGGDHTDCVQRRRIELEDEDLKKGLPERLDLAGGRGGLGPEIRAVLDYMAREKSRE